VRDLAGERADVPDLDFLGGRSRRLGRFGRRLCVGLGGWLLLFAAAGERENRGNERDADFFVHLILLGVALDGLNNTAPRMDRPDLLWAHF
jgi:hypothetical protein